MRRSKAGESTLMAEVSADAGEERFFVGLRLSEGIQPRADEWVRWNQPIERFLSNGLLESSGNWLRLTDRGVLLSNEVFAEFITI